MDVTTRIRIHASRRSGKNRQHLQIRDDSQPTAAMRFFRIRLGLMTHTGASTCDACPCSAATLDGWHPPRKDAPLPGERRHRRAPAQRSIHLTAQSPPHRMTASSSTAVEGASDRISPRALPALDASESLVGEILGGVRVGRSIAASTMSEVYLSSRSAGIRGMATTAIVRASAVNWRCIPRSSHRTSRASVRPAGSAEPSSWSWST
jgi:hypothetical protein